MLNLFFLGGEGIYLECPLLLKISKIKTESRGHGVLKFKLVLLWLNKKGFRSKLCLGPGPGACKFEYLEIWIFYFEPKFEAQNQGYDSVTGNPT